MLKKIISSLKNNLLVRNIVLAISLIIIMMVAANLILKVVTRHGQKNKVPNFSGLTMTEAANVAADLELRLEIVDSLYIPSQGKGVILEQYPKPGNFVKSGRRIFLTTNTVTPKMVPVPYVTGFSLRQAKNKLVGSGFVIDRLIYVEDIATNNVLSQSYDGKAIISSSNMMAQLGSGITLTVGQNPVDAEPITPSLIGLSLAEAKNRIWEAGFNVGTIDIDPDVNYENMDKAVVYEQSPHMSFKGMYGRSISLGLTLDTKKVETSRKEAQKEAEKYLKEQQAKEDSLKLLEEASPEEIEEFFNNVE